MFRSDIVEFLGATYKGVQTGTFGTYNVNPFSGNKFITETSGEILLTAAEETANKVMKWSTQACEAAP